MKHYDLKHECDMDVVLRRATRYTTYFENSGVTVLMEAVRGGKIDMVRLLLGLPDIDVNLRRHGVSSCHVCTNCGNFLIFIGPKKLTQSNFIPCKVKFNEHHEL